MTVPEVERFFSRYVRGPILGIIGVTALLVGALAAAELAFNSDAYLMTREDRFCATALAAWAIFLGGLFSYRAFTLTYGK